MVFKELEIQGFKSFPERFDLPEPLGPTTPVTPASKVIFTLSGKLLKLLGVIKEK